MSHFIKGKRAISVILSLLLIFSFSPIATNQNSARAEQSTLQFTEESLTSEQDNEIDFGVLETLEEGIDYSPCEVVVSFKDDIGDRLSLESSQDVVKDVNAKVNTDDVIDDKTCVVDVKDNVDVLQAIKKLSEDPNVESAEPNYLFTLDDDEASLKTTTINDRRASEQWYLNDSNANIYNYWDLVKCEKKVTVAVIDSGIDSDHPDLEANIVAPTSVVSSDVDRSGYSSYEDISGHGTHVAGIVSGVANNEIGVAGVSYNANVMPIRAFYQGQTKPTAEYSDIIKGIQYAINNKSRYNVKVINMSFGYSGKVDEDKMTNLSEAITKAWNAGILCVCASGNGSSSAYLAPVVYPASDSKTLAVGSIGSSHAWSDFSSGGSALDVVAPGDDILSTVVGGDYGTEGGTSMAAPYVSAICASLCVVDSTLTPSKLLSTIRSSATDLGAIGKDNYYGYGQVNPIKAYQVVKNSKSGIGTPIYRFCNKFTAEHFYTKDINEAKALEKQSKNWIYEGIAWQAPTSSNTAVRRFCNRYTGEHFFTTNATEIKALLKNKGFINENVAWYASDTKTSKPVYRFLNKVTSEHFFTSDVNEANALTKQTKNWKKEGVGWYGLS